MRERRPRILYLGLNGPFSRAPLAALLAAGQPVVALLLPAEEGSTAPIRHLQPAPSPSDLPLLTPYVAKDTVHLAWLHRIPVYAVRDLDAPETVRTVAALQPEVACVACFPWRIPGSLLHLPVHGFLNLHPSLLPAYRGPYPLFWTFRAGVRETGVTLHYMDERLDTGDIVSQAPLRLPDGISGREADVRAGEIGAGMLGEAIGRLAATGSLPRHPQPAGGRFYPRPAAPDFHIDARWPARRAFNFMRGTAGWGQAYTLATGGKLFRLGRALAYHPQQKLETGYQEDGRDVWLQFTPGVLHAHRA